MKQCTYCGKELFDEAVICPGCGCPTQAQTYQQPTSHINRISNDIYVHTLSSRLKTNSIIWLVIGILQIILGWSFNWSIAVIGVINVIFAIKDIKFSEEILARPVGIVGRIEPLLHPLLSTIYNVLFGGLIGMVAVFHYMIAVRSFVKNNRYHFIEIENAFYKS